MKQNHPLELDFVLPVHNEVTSIRRTLEEIYRFASEDLGIKIRFILSEDGSTDGTRDLIKRIVHEFPIVLISSARRKGYSRAVIDGLRRAEKPYVAFLDSDGQYDPRDLRKLLAELKEADISVGYRSPRSDPWSRRAMSRLFFGLYRSLFPVRLRDPSCSFLVVRREALQKILSGRVGRLKQGFWWEFMARATQQGYRIAETPVSHYRRKNGETKIYQPLKIPRIALEHVVGLVLLREELLATDEAISKAGEIS